MSTQTENQTNSCAVLVHQTLDSLSDQFNSPREVIAQVWLDMMNAKYPDIRAAAPNTASGCGRTSSL